MKKHPQLIVGLVLALVFFLSACGNNTATPAVTMTDSPDPTSVPTNTPDPCAPENREAEAMKIHKYMREFDDASNLATVQQGEQMTTSIAELQRIRREAEEQVTPPCMGDLKAYQVSHMNAVINTLIAMMGGRDQQLIDQGVAVARDQHDQYLIELARVLGLTVEPANITPLATETPTP